MAKRSSLTESDRVDESIKVHVNYMFQLPLRVLTYLLVTSNRLYCIEVFGSCWNKKERSFTRSPHTPSPCTIKRCRTKPYTGYSYVYTICNQHVVASVHQLYVLVCYIGHSHSGVACYRMSDRWNVFL